MHDILAAVILGIVEGVTEFLPVSSTGHLIIVNQWLSFDPSFTRTFDIVIQLGAIAAVVCYFWKKVCSGNFRAFWPKVLVGVIPALVVGALAGGAIQELLFDPLVVACALIAGGIVLIIAEKIRPSETIHEVEKLSYGRSLAIGAIQCLSFIPGTSRAAATIVGGLFLRMKRSVAVEFSFFLAVPTMAAASAYSLLTVDAHLSGRQWMILAVGFLVSFAVALAVIKWFMRYVQERTFVPFGYYRILIGMIVLAFFFL